MSENYAEYLRHIRDECGYIVTTMREIESFEAFIAHEDKKRAVVRSLEIIGEATKRIPVNVKFKWNQIDWRAIAGMRDKLIHDYSEVDYLIVWDAVEQKIPALKTQVEQMLQELA